VLSVMNIRGFVCWPERLPGDMTGRRSRSRDAVRMLFMASSSASLVVCSWGSSPPKSGGFCQVTITALPAHTMSNPQSKTTGVQLLLP
jgi:hypothetical protein